MVTDSCWSITVAHFQLYNTVQLPSVLRQPKRDRLRQGSLSQSWIITCILLVLMGGHKPKKCCSSSGTEKPYKLACTLFRQQRLSYTLHTTEPVSRTYGSNVLLSVAYDNEKLVTYSSEEGKNLSYPCISISSRITSSGNVMVIVMGLPPLLGAQ